MAITTADRLSAQTASQPRRGALMWMRRNKTIVGGVLILLALVTVAVLAPWLAGDPLQFEPTSRLKRPSDTFWFGTDQFGRDVYSRVVYGTRISLIIGFSVALLATFVGLVVGVLCGYYRPVDAVVMRIMDGMMAIPASARDRADRADEGEPDHRHRRDRDTGDPARRAPRAQRRAVGARTPLHRGCDLERLAQWPHHAAPHPAKHGGAADRAGNLCRASAILTEAGLSFLGAGTPPEIPSWGNIISLGRTFFQIAPWIIFFPGVLLAITVLAINLVGDGLRDSLDPRISRRM